MTITNLPWPVIEFGRIAAELFDRAILESLTKSTRRRSGKKILHTRIIDGREWQLHATKGWRSRRA